MDDMTSSSSGEGDEDADFDTAPERARAGNVSRVRSWGWTQLGVGASCTLVRLQVSFKFHNSYKHHDNASKILMEYMHHMQPRKKYLI